MKGKERHGKRERCRQFAEFLIIEPNDTRKEVKRPMTSVRFKPVISKKNTCIREEKRKDKCTKCLTSKPAYQPPTIEKTINQAKYQ
jgi:hypothetical protein